MSDVQAGFVLTPQPRATRAAAAPSRLLRSGAVQGLLGLALVFLLWAIAIRFAGPFAQRFAPEAAFAALFELLRSGEILRHVAASLQRVLVGLVLAIAVGVPVGLAVGRFRTVETATTPAFQFLRMISPLSWMPIAVMAFGVGDRPIYFLLAFACVWPILLNTAAGVRALDATWIELARSLAATRRETLLRVVLPGILGHVLTGIRLAIGIAWIVLVPCEMLGVSAGLGYFILDTRDRLAYGELGATVLLIGMLGFLLDMLARWLHAAWTPGATKR